MRDEIGEADAPGHHGGRAPVTTRVPTSSPATTSTSVATMTAGQQRGALEGVLRAVRAIPAPPVALSRLPPRPPSVTEVWHRQRDRSVVRGAIDTAGALIGPIVGEVRSWAGNVSDAVFTTIGAVDDVMHGESPTQTVVQGVANNVVGNLATNTGGTLPGPIPAANPALGLPGAALVNGAFLTFGMAMNSLRDGDERVAAARAGTAWDALRDSLTRHADQARFEGGFAVRRANVASVPAHGIPEPIDRERLRTDGDYHRGVVEALERRIEDLAR